MGAAEEDSSDPTQEDCQRLKRECVAMVEFLKELENEETELTIQNEILGRECISNGWPMHLQDPKPPGKRRRATSTKGKTAAQKEEQTAPVSNMNKT